MTDRFQVRLTDAAAQDVASIDAYLTAHGSSQIAEKLLDKLSSRIDSLEQFPRRGAIVPHLEGSTDELRQFLVGVYRGIYLIEDEVVSIIAVLDGRRNIQPLLEQRLLTRPKRS